MKPLAFALLLTAASMATAGDPVHTAKEMDPSMKELSWLLGNWEADGDFMGVKYKEYVRYWPVAGGKALMERAYAVGPDKSMLHEDRIVFTNDDDGMKASFYEATPARATRYALKLSEGKIEFAPITAGGPTLVYTKTGDDSYEYVFTGKDEKGADFKATGKAKRTTESYPDPKTPVMGKTLKPLSGLLGEFEGIANGEDESLMEERVSGRAILGGDVLELVVTDKGPGVPENARSWAWFDTNANAWCLDRLDRFGALLSYAATVEEGKLHAKAGTNRVTFSIAWTCTDKGYTCSLRRVAELNQIFKFASFGRPATKKTK